MLNFVLGIGGIVVSKIYMCLFQRNVYFNGGDEKFNNR